MKNIKKLIYFYLVFLLLAWLILPFGVKAESFGTIDLTNAISDQIETGKTYGFRFNVDEASDFLFNNIDEIILYKTEDPGTEDISPSIEVTRSSATYTPSDAKQKFENSSIVISTNSSVKNIEIYALVKYHTNAGQAKTFTTNPTPYTVISATTQPTDNVLTPSPVSPLILLPVSPGGGFNPNSLPPTSNVNTNTGGGGSISTFILGASCSKDNIVSCYAQKIIRLLIIIASIGSIGMIIFGGIMLITSGGDPKKITTGKSAVTAAIIGLIIVLLALSIQIFIQKIITGGEPSQIATGGTLDNSGGSPSDTVTILVTSDGNEYNVVYKKSATATPENNIVGGECNINPNITIGSINVNCGRIKSALEGEEVYSQYVSKVVIDPGNGDANVYHDGVYDTWTATIALVPKPVLQPYAGGGSSGYSPNPRNPEITIDIPLIKSNCDAIAKTIKDYYNDKHYWIDAYSRNGSSPSIWDNLFPESNIKIDKNDSFYIRYINIRYKTLLKEKDPTYIQYNAIIDIYFKVPGLLFYNQGTYYNLGHKAFFYSFETSPSQTPPTISPPIVFYSGSPWFATDNPKYDDGLVKFVRIPKETVSCDTLPTIFPTSGDGATSQTITIQ